MMTKMLRCATVVCLYVSVGPVVSAEETGGAGVSGRAVPAARSVAAVIVGRADGTTDCCLPDNTCAENIDPFKCANLGGSQVFNCQAIYPCGACCIANNTCRSLPRGICEAPPFYGVWLGPDPICGDDPRVGPCVGPDVGCCVNGTCASTDFSTCLQLGGVFVGSACQEADCPETGACCLVSGLCVPVDLDTCFAVEGSFAGFGRDCSSTPCPVACPADIDGDGVVTFDDLLMVLLDWGPCPS